MINSYNEKQFNSLTFIPILPLELFLLIKIWQLRLTLPCNFGHVEKFPNNYSLQLFKLILTSGNKNTGHYQIETIKFLACPLLINTIVKTETLKTPNCFNDRLERETL